MRFLVLLIESIFYFSDEIYNKKFINCGVLDQESFIISCDSGEEINLKEFLEYLTMNVLTKKFIITTFEIDVLQNSIINVFKLLNLPNNKESLISYHNKTQIIWEIFLQYLLLIQKTNYRKELNVITMNITIQTLEISVSQKITIAFKILEQISVNIQNSVTRYFLMIICCYNLILASVELLKQGKLNWNLAIIYLYYYIITNV